MAGARHRRNDLGAAASGCSGCRGTVDLVAVERNPAAPRTPACRPRIHGEPPPPACARRPTAPLRTRRQRHRTAPLGPCRRVGAERRSDPDQGLGLGVGDDGRLLLCGGLLRAQHRHDDEVERVGEGGDRVQAAVVGEHRELALLEHRLDPSRGGGVEHRRRAGEAKEGVGHGRHASASALGDERRTRPARRRRVSRRRERRRPDAPRPSRTRCWASSRQARRPPRDRARRRGSSPEDLPGLEHRPVLELRVAAADADGGRGLDAFQRSAGDHRARRHQRVGVVQPLRVLLLLLVRSGAFSDRRRSGA